MVFTDQKRIVVASTSDSSMKNGDDFNILTTDDPTMLKIVRMWKLISTNRNQVATQ